MLATPWFKIRLAACATMACGPSKPRGASEVQGSYAPDYCLGVGGGAWATAPRHSLGLTSIFWTMRRHSRMLWHFLRFGMPVHVFPTFVMPMHVPNARFRLFAKPHCFFSGGLSPQLPCEFKTDIFC